MKLFERLILPIGETPKDGWVKWKHSGIPDEENEFREKARDDAETNRHCKICTGLSGCYFPAFNMPKYPQHTYCDCMLFAIPKPVAQAVANCPISKFTGYIFVPENSKGKTELFISWGFTVEDSERLKAEFEKQAVMKYLRGDYSLHGLDDHGQRITITIELISSEKSVKIKTGWIVRTLGLITCATPYSGEVK